MKKILFTHSYFMRFDPKQWSNSQPYAPIGPLYAAALLRNNGFGVSFFDTMFSQTPDEILPSLDNHRPDIFVVYDDGFNYLTKMCLTNMRNAAFTMIRAARARGCTVIASSSDATDHVEEYLANGAHYILLGEAEQTLLQLTTALSEGRTDVESIAGLAFRHDDTIVQTAKRAVLRDLDLLSPPAWDLIDIEPYRKMWMKRKGYFSMNMATTRGCPFKCNWCAKPIYGNRYNSRSPANVVAELKLLRENYRFDHIWFCDDIFGLKPGWVKEFADLLEKESLSFQFKIQARADLLLQEDYIRDLARAGCTNVWMGAESGSQKILDAMDKGTTVTQIYEATRLLKKHHIHPSFFIQFGYPGETKEDIYQTIAMINALLPLEIGISVSYPLPGTAFYEQVKSQLKSKANWTDSDELALMFHNTYSAGFYKQLHRYVHRNYRKHIALETARNLFVKSAPVTFAKIKKAISLLYYTPATWLARQRLTKIDTGFA